jgi:hypothetical protein
MADLALLDRAYFLIMQRFINTGQAPHYTALASALGLSVEEGRQVLQDLMEAGVAGWLHPGTDYIVSLAPFHNLPTQYAITIDGHKNGLPSEASSRWRCAGCFLARQCRWRLPVWTVGSQWWW